MGLDFKNTTSVADYELWALAHREKEPSKTPRFMTLSVGAHLLALSLIAVLATPLVKEIEPEVVTIEIEDVRPLPPMAASRGLDVPETQGSSASAAPMIAEKISHEDVVTPAPVSKKAVPSKPSMAAKTNFQAVPATIDDIEAPELDAGEFAQTPVAASNFSDDLNKDFSDIDSRHAEQMAEEKQEMDSMATALAVVQDNDLNDLAEQNDQEQTRMMQAQEDLRKKNAAAMASALAAENAARASRLATQQEAAKGAALARGKGLGNNGANQRGAALAGTPTGIRSLDQLRQMPGNPRPQYDREERRRGDQGEVAFAAYITKEGYPSQFKLLKSTGFRNLDGKTLTALKKWRFYPGQEGWVELPFRWDLKGGVQEDGGLLRRAVSSR